MHAMITYDTIIFKLYIHFKNISEKGILDSHCITHKSFECVDLILLIFICDKIWARWTQCGNRKQLLERRKTKWMQTHSSVLRQGPLHSWSWYQVYEPPALPPGCMDYRYGPPGLVPQMFIIKPRSPNSNADNPYFKRESSKSIIWVAQNPNR